MFSFNSFVLFLRLSLSQNRAGGAYFNIKLWGRSRSRKYFQSGNKLWSQLFQMEPAVPTGALMQRWSIKAFGDAEFKEHRRYGIAGWRSWRKVVVLFSVWWCADEEAAERKKKMPKLAEDLQNLFWSEKLTWRGSKRENWFNVKERLKITR